MKESRLIHLTDLGRKEYKETWDLQEMILKENLEVKANAREEGITDPNLVPTKHQVLLVEHPPVYTLGKSGHMEHVLISEEEQREKGISLLPYPVRVLILFEERSPLYPGYRRAQYN